MESPQRSRLLRRLRGNRDFQEVVTGLHKRSHRFFSRHKGRAINWPGKKIAQQGKEKSSTLATGHPSITIAGGTQEKGNSHRSHSPFEGFESIVCPSNWYAHSYKRTITRINVNFTQLTMRAPSSQFAFRSSQLGVRRPEFWSLSGLQDCGQWPCGRSRGQRSMRHNLSIKGNSPICHFPFPI